MVSVEEQMSLAEILELGALKNTKIAENWENKKKKKDEGISQKK